MRALVIDADGVNRLSRSVDIGIRDGVFRAVAPGVSEVIQNDIVYLLSEAATRESRLLVINNGVHGPLKLTAENLKPETFQRILRCALSQFWPGLVKLPMSWKSFRSGSLISFQANRLQTGVTARVYLDVSPEGTNHVYAYYLATSDSEPLVREHYSVDVLEDAYLNFDLALTARPASSNSEHDIGHKTYALTKSFKEADITQGLPFSVWRDAKLSRQQRKFFDAPFGEPLRVKGPAGSGKTLVLAMRFLKEVYERIDSGRPVHACFLTHSDEGAEHILNYLVQIDERGLFFDSDRGAFDVEITTPHNLANRYINQDADNIQPLSLDSSEGRKMQLEVIEEIIGAFLETAWKLDHEGCRPEFVSALEAPKGESTHRAFCFDLSDEFANVLETLGVRALDDIALKYLRARPHERALAQNQDEKRIVLELYRRFRQFLSDLNVVSLDQFTADFLAYLNSFRWEALRKEKGFDFVFADELHLFNSQERRILGYLLRESELGKRVAVAYDPRQSPRNSFFPEAESARDTVWTEAKLETSAKAFEFTDVFRYTPQILTFLARLNQHFPATDLAEDWSLTFGKSEVVDGPLPTVHLARNWSEMLAEAVSRSKVILRNAKKEESVAILCLDPDRFATYPDSKHFEGAFIFVSGRDDVDIVGRYTRRVVVSMPEFVAGLQFTSVLIIDVNASLVAELGGGVNGLHRFISRCYLGASRAKNSVELFCDQTEGGFAEPIKDALNSGCLLVQS